MATLLRDLLQHVPAYRLEGSGAVTISGVFCDSREVRPGGLFAAVSGGQERDRHEFVGDAVQRGAAALLVDRSVGSQPCAVVRVDDARGALAQVAAAFYGRPGDALRLIGVTGTNGKTTTALLVRHMLSAAGEPCGYLGTLGVQAASGNSSLRNTTPEAPVLHAELRRLVDSGHRAAVLEVSSHGLVLRRVAGLRFAVGVFTNLTRDHLDFHGTQENYLDAKGLLFASLDREAVAVLNADDAHASALRARCAGTVVTYGRHQETDYRIEAIEPLPAGTRLRLRWKGGVLALETRLHGEFNAYNVAAAAACCLELGADEAAVREGLRALVRVAGRFEAVDVGQPFRVIVDYAHTPDGLCSVLRAARQLTRGRLFCVFGCGGDRDPGKRPLMGRVVEDLADVPVVTSDNPRSEDPEAIIAAILAGMARPQAATVDADRRAAIQFALAQARPGDTVVIAGKGHEQGQIIGSKIFPFDDVVVARELLTTPQVVVEERA